MSDVSDRDHLFREVFDHAYDAILMLDPAHDRVLDANRTAQQMLGYRREDLRSLPLSQILLGPEDVLSCGNFSARGWIGPLVFRASDGQTVLTETSVSRAESTEGTYLIAAARQTTEYRPAKEAGRRDAELRRIARISTVSELAAALANEINQPLTAVVLNARTVQRTANDETLSETLREALSDIADDSRRAGETIWNLRRLLQGEGPERRRVNFSCMIGEITALVHERATREDVKLILELAADLPTVRGDPLYLQLVVLNLAKNAIEVMHDTPVERRVLTLQTTVEEGSVRASVRDRGSGLTPETKAQMFEPFFTTRPGRLGLGLAICHSIIEAHGGCLWAESNPGGGSVVHFALPAEAGTTAEAETAETRVDP